MDETRYVNVVNAGAADDADAYRSIPLALNTQSIRRFIVALDAMGATHISGVTSQPVDPLPDEYLEVLEQEQRERRPPDYHEASGRKDDSPGEQGHRPTRKG